MPAMMAAKVLPSTSTRVSVTLPRGRDLTTGLQLTDTGSPRVTTQFMTSVGRWMPTGMLALRATWSNGLKSDSRQSEQRDLLSRPAYWVLNAELATTLMGTRATLVVSNLLNHPYQEPLSFIPESGRTYTFALKRDFQVPFATANKEHSR